MYFQTDLTSSGLANYKRRPSVANSKYPTPVVPNSSYITSVSGKPVPQKRSETDGVSAGIARNSSTKNRQNATVSKSPTATSENHQGNKQKKPKLPELKPTFSTFKQFNRTASLSDLINEDDDSTVVVKPDVIQKNQPRIIKNSQKRQTNTTNHNNHTTSNKNIHLDTLSLASVNVNIPDPVLPPTKSITVQTDEALDLNLADFGNSNGNSDTIGNRGKSDPLRISTEPLLSNDSETHRCINGLEISLSTSFDSMDDSKSKSTDVSMEDALQNASKDVDEYEEDLPTPPATPPIEERLKSPMSTTSRSPPSPTIQITPTKKVMR